MAKRYSKDVERFGEKVIELVLEEETLSMEEMGVLFAVLAGGFVSGGFVSLSEALFKFSACFENGFLGDALTKVAQERVNLLMLKHKQREGGK